MKLWNYEIIRLTIKTILKQNPYKYTNITEKKIYIWQILVYQKRTLKPIKSN